MCLLSLHAPLRYIKIWLFHCLTSFWWHHFFFKRKTYRAQWSMWSGLQTWHITFSTKPSLGCSRYCDIKYSVSVLYTCTWPTLEVTTADWRLAVFLAKGYSGTGVGKNALTEMWERKPVCDLTHMWIHFLKMSLCVLICKSTISVQVTTETKNGVRDEGGGEPPSVSNGN